mmetsp:Transcript_4661/g.6900  ORF Transcript_4661/g.6900 Transcript_4661/m.6900 type:complete len:373 (+) Transcript_4661:152-1270(+)
MGWTVIKRYPPLWNEESLPVDEIPCENDNNDNFCSGSKSSSSSSKSMRTSSFNYRRNKDYWDSFPSEFLQECRIRPLSDIVRDSLALGQEVALVSLVLSLHHYILYVEHDDEQQLFVTSVFSSWRSSSLVSLGFFTLFLVAIYGEEGAVTRSTWIQARTDRLQTRLPDAILLAIILRMLSAVLRTLTASYSSDTVMLLASCGMVLHLIACDYNYANGHGSMDLRRRPKFKGGKVSLNAAFFSVTLLTSRLHSNALAFIFVSTSIVAFAFYPDARHRMARRSHCSACWRLVGNISFLEVLVFIPLFTSAYIALLSCHGHNDHSTRTATFYLLVQAMVCIVGPLNMYYFQRYRRIIVGPWDIANINEKIDDDDN